MAPSPTPLRKDQTLRNMPPAEWAARVDLAAAYRYAQHAGWNDLIFNHITLRVPGEPDYFLIKPHELLFEEVTASSLLKLDMQGRQAGEEKPINPAATTIHGTIEWPPEDGSGALDAGGAALSTGATEALATGAALAEALGVPAGLPAEEDRFTILMSSEKKA